MNSDNTTTIRARVHLRISDRVLEPGETAEVSPHEAAVFIERNHANFVQGAEPAKEPKTNSNAFRVPIPPDEEESEDEYEEIATQVELHEIDDEEDEEVDEESD